MLILTNCQIVFVIQEVISFGKVVRIEITIVKMIKMLVSNNDYNARDYYYASYQINDNMYKGMYSTYPVIHYLRFTK